MKIGVILGHRYNRVNDQYYTYTSYHADMWKEHLEVFDEVLLLDKANHLKEIPGGQKPVLVDGVSFVEFPSKKGVLQIFALPSMFNIARKTVKQADVWNLHAPDLGTFCLWFWAVIFKVPYMIELRGDQSLTVNYLKLRGVLFAKYIALLQRFNYWLQRSNPIAIVSVAENYFKSYPSRNNCPCYTISDNRIPDNWYGEIRRYSEKKDKWSIVTVGRVEAQKNPIGTIRALAKLNDMGFSNWEFSWLGDGPMLAKVKDEIKKYNLQDQVTMKGFVKWEDVFRLLDSSDLFLLNTVSEGLPRALVEGMARGLPAIAARVGGVPELLSDEYIFPPLDNDALAKKLFEVLNDVQQLELMSETNLIKAREYAAEKLASRKKNFYISLKKQVMENQK